MSVMSVGLRRKNLERARPRPAGRSASRTIWSRGGSHGCRPVSSRRFPDMWNDFPTLCDSFRRQLQNIYPL